jgi:hypothetical protein
MVAGCGETRRNSLTSSAAGSPAGSGTFAGQSSTAGSAPVGGKTAIEGGTSVGGFADGGAPPEKISSGGAGGDEEPSSGASGQPGTSLGGASADAGAGAAGVGGVEVDACGGCQAPKSKCNFDLGFDVPLECICPVGSTGTDCEVDTGSCPTDGSTSCLNGGTCQDGDVVPSCACDDGHVGFRCRAIVGLQLKQVAVGGDTACGIRLDDTLICWGAYDLQPPSGTFVKVAVEEQDACAIATDGSLSCWRGDGFALVPPPGKFTDLALNAQYDGCALTAEGEVRCWGAHYSPDVTPPEFAGRQFVSISGGYFMCALGADGTPACEVNLGIPPAESLQMIQSGDDRACAVREDGSAAFWGNTTSLRMPQGSSFKWIGELVGRVCTLDSAGTLGCGAAYYGLDGLINAFDFPGKYLSASASAFIVSGARSICAIRDDQHVVCFTDIYAHAVVPPID